MKRREFLTGTVGLAGAAFPFLGYGETRPCPPPSLGVSGGTSADGSCISVSADADWAARSSGAGVVWAHDFVSDSEMSQFLMSPNPIPLTHPLVPGVRSESLFGSSRVLVNRCIASALTQPVKDSTKGAIETFYLADASPFPDPETVGEYLLLIGGANADGQTQEEVAAVAKNGNTLTVRRAAGLGDPIARPAGSFIGHAPSARWSRLMCAFPAGANGKSTPDIGIAHGYQEHEWTATPSNLSMAHWRWRTGWWGHQSYFDLYNSVWPVAPYSDSYGRTFKNAFEGTEFWIQFRMKISESRFHSPRGKIMYLQNAHRSNAQQLYFVVEPDNPLRPERNRQFRMECNFGLNPSNTLISGTAAWQYPSDDWATYMIHMKPGRYGAAETLLEVFAARRNQSAFTTLFSQGNLSWPYHLDNMDNQAPPAFNSFQPCSYPNAYVGTGSSGPPTTTNTIEFTQVILSSKPIACPASA